MIKVGITGGICSGKSTVCKYIESLGYPVFYSDVVAKKLANFDEELKQEVTSLFGEESYKDGVYNAKYISDIVFKDKKSLDLINALFKVRVKREWDIFIQDKDIAFFESALVFEHDIKDYFDYIVCIYCDIETIKKRLKIRNNFTDEEISDRLRNQIDVSVKISNSDFSIDTSASNTDYEKQIVDYINTIKH